MINRDRLYVHVPVHRLLEQLDDFLQLGFNAEIYINSEFIDNFSDRDLGILNSAFKKHGLSKTVHGPFIDLNPGSADRRVRSLTLQRFLVSMDLCRKLDAKALIIHTHFDPIFYGRHFKEWVDNASPVWEQVIEDAKRHSMPVYIENSIDDSPEPVLEILKNHPYFGACFDVAHYSVFTDTDYKQILDMYPVGVIKEVHLSDNKGEEDSHLALGEGTIDFKDFLARIVERKEDPIITIESHSIEALKKSLGFMKQFIDDV